MNHPGLIHHQEFKKVLSSYHLSDRAKAALDGLKLVLLLAPSSTGRNTIIRELVGVHSYHFIISDTTRQPQVRDGVLEQSGSQYYFRTEEEMLADLRSGEFLEAEIIHNQQVSGISIRELEKAKELHKIAVTDIDIGGINNIMRVKPDATAFFLVPPSFEEWQKRLVHRGPMTEQELRNRLRTAQIIFNAGLQNHAFQFVITEDVRQSAQIIDDVVHGHPNPHQGRAVGLIHQLQDRLEQKLSSNPV